MYLIETNSITPFGAKIDIEKMYNKLNSTKNKFMFSIQDSHHDFIVDYVILVDKNICKNNKCFGKYFKENKDIFKYLNKKYPNCKLKEAF